MNEVYIESSHLAEYAKTLVENQEQSDCYFTYRQEISWVQRLFQDCLNRMPLPT